MVFDGDSFHQTSFSRATTWRMRCSLVEGLPGDNSSTKETCSRRSFVSSLEGVGAWIGCGTGNRLSRILNVSSQESYTPMDSQKRPDPSSADSNVQVTMLSSNLKLDVSGLLRVEAGCEVAENMVTEVE